MRNSSVPFSPASRPLARDPGGGQINNQIDSARSLEALSRQTEVNMRTELATAAALAGLVAMTAPAAAQGWGYGGWSEPGVSVSVGFGAPAYYDAYAPDWGYRAGYRAPAAAYAYSGPAGCSCPTSAGYGYSTSYSYRPAYGSTAYAYEPTYAAGTAYAYDPGYRYGSSVEYDTYAYRSGPRYVARGSRVAVRGESRQITRSRDVVQSRSLAREQGIARTSSRDQAFARGDVRERGASVRTGAAARSNEMMQGAPEMRGGTGATMRGDATVGRGGAEARGETGARAPSRAGMSNQDGRSVR